MDTGTHFVTGLALAGLAHLDPAVTADMKVTAAVLIGTAAGSQAPDLDGLLRLKGNSAYIRHHRGPTHSLPAIVGWTVAITALLRLLFGELSLFTIALWTGIAVSVHVFQDLFNSYGTKVLWPFSHKWVAWNVIHIFDPFIFISQFVAIAMWLLQWAEPVLIFPVLYSLLAVYYTWRCTERFRVRKSLVHQDRLYRAKDHDLIIPTVHPFHWNVVRMRGDEFLLGEWKNGRLTWIDHLVKARHPAIDASIRHPDIAALLSHSSYVCPELRTHRWGYEVRWLDVRYRHRKHYPFVGVLLLDHNLEPLDAYVGWLSHTKLEKKLRVDSYG